MDLDYIRKTYNYDSETGVVTYAVSAGCRKKKVRKLGG